MKLERHDTEPMHEDNDNFRSLLSSDTSTLSLSRIDTADLRDFENLVDSNDSSTRSSGNTFNTQVPETQTDNTMLLQQVYNIGSFTNIFNDHEQEIVWPLENDIETELFPETTIQSVNHIVRGLTLPPSTSTAVHNVKVETPYSTVGSLLSLSSWPGNFNFSISITTDEKDRNKVSYSQTMNKLFVCPDYVVPVTISLTRWEGASLSVMAMFKKKEHQQTPVTRCYNCKTTSVFQNHKQNHILHVEDNTADYSLLQDHCVVTLPLVPPPPGETSATVLIKSTCLTSHTGGPGRKPFCAIFTLKIDGQDAGRQVVEIKCCKCPGRDKEYDEAALNQTNQTKKKLTKVKKIKISDACNGVATKRQRTDTNESTDYTTIRIRKEFEKPIKRLLNQLEAERYMKENHPELLPFSNEELE